MKIVEILKSCIYLLVRITEKNKNCPKYFTNAKLKLFRYIVQHGISGSHFSPKKEAKEGECPGAAMHR